MDFIGIGIPKSGTSWLFTCLVEHPNICGPSINPSSVKNKILNTNNSQIAKKEIEFFDKNYHNGINYYESLFTHKQPHQISGEFSPSYLIYDGVAELIYQHLPNIKLIACLREPIECLHSGFHYFIQRRAEQGHLPLTDDTYSEANITKYFESMPKLIEKIRYRKRLERYFQLFESKSLHIIRYQDIQEHPAEVLRTTYQFLGVNPDFSAPSLEQKVNYTIKYSTRSLALQRLSQFIFEKAIFRKSPTLMKGGQFVKKALQYINQFNYDKESCSSQPSNSFIVLAKSYLGADYLDEIEKIEQITSKDFSRWKQYWE